MAADGLRFEDGTHRASTTGTATSLGVQDAFDSWQNVDGGTRPAPEWSSIGAPQTPEAAETGYYRVRAPIKPVTVDELASLCGDGPT